MQHTGSVVQVEQQIVDAGAEVIWILAQDGFGTPGTAQSCRNFMDSQGSELGWCVGDGQTAPTAEAFMDSPFGNGKGFDMVVVRETMEVVFVTSHGIGGGFENLTGEELLAEIQMIAENL